MQACVSSSLVDWRYLHEQHYGERICSVSVSLIAIDDIIGARSVGDRQR